MEKADQISGIIFDAFEIDGSLLPAHLPDEEKLSAIRSLLILRIEEMADREMEKLMWTLYRIDVNEKKLNDSLRGIAPNQFAPVIADLIIERQLEKVKSRKEFGGEENDWNFDL